MAETQYPGNIIPAPGYSKGPISVDEELAFSYTGRFTQKGCHLKAGQGVLRLGTVLAYDTAAKRTVRWVSGGANGTGTPTGILRQTVNTGLDPAGREYQNNVVISGILKLNLISSANSGSITSAVTALGATTNAVLNTFTI